MSDDALELENITKMFPAFGWITFRFAARSVKSTPL
jgi:hypothetical protein